MQEPNPLEQAGKEKLKELRAEAASLKASIRELEAEGLIAAKGTAIASYKARSGKGNYYDYFKLIRGKNEPLIHLGKEENEWTQLFREAMSRRQKLDALVTQRTKLYADIRKLEDALFPNKHRKLPSLGGDVAIAPAQLLEGDSSTGTT